MNSNKIKWPNSRILELFNIENPIIQAGMVWVSGGNLAAAAADAGCLGLLGAGSMHPELLKEQIKKAKSLTKKPIGVNIPLLYNKTEEQIKVALDEGIRIFFTSAGSPKTWTPFLKKEGCIVVHVASTPEFAKKSQDAGVDAVVVEGFEAGGHNGRDEITTLVLLQQIYNKLTIPIIVAGGIGSGAAILAAFAMGAEAVQIGTAFAATKESSAHENFKMAMCKAQFNSTFLRMKKLVPVRLLENEFAKKIAQAEDSCATKDQLQEILGKGRAKEGMLNGNIQEGELEVGQIVSEVNEILSCNKLVQKLKHEYIAAKQSIL
ncbi:NAD(P)H-dependent flavin oxidoreductase [Fluviispira multicolorata]|uniref:Nitronate monooxygenase n=1 Tax=Fluviispira multicolorata TaxID=2654512 RepID=A0A833JBA5_9BACT|nr:nitronate monooxygenase [Fluviispira multicolorata]KAB8029069.1 nitronate monooxygenase [Fluviispira multicolorata]